MLQLAQVLSTTAPDTHISSTLYANTSAYGKNTEQGERVAIMQMTYEGSGNLQMTSLCLCELFLTG